jgi:hypothetical protein
MLLYEYQVRDEFRRVIDLAARIREKFHADRPSDELLRDRDILEGAYQQLDRMLPSEVDRGYVGRHLHFMKYYLQQDKPNDALRDADDICDLDLPKLESAFLAWCKSHEHYDKELSEAISPLLRDRHLDSAIRKSFVILSGRLVVLYDVPTDLDGRDLVNRIFGTTGCLAGKIPNDEREALRNLLDGLYGVFRNLFGHRNLEAQWYEADAILSMVNWALKKLPAMS